MTDHLTDARACVTSASQAPHTATAVSWLTATCEQIIAHLEAQRTPARKEPTMNDQYETDFNRWLDSLSPGQREQITRDIEAAHDLIRAEAWDEAVDTLWDEAVDTLSGPWEDMIPAQIADLDRRNPYRKEQP